MNRPQRKTRRARLAVLAALAMLSGPVTAAVHYATVTHVVCAEHGGTVHLAAPLEAAPGHGGEHADGSERHDPGRSPSDEHSHCELVATRVQGTALEAPQPLAAPCACPTPLLASVLPAPVRAVVSVYAFAPKTSPPSGDAARV
jgi:hypothetical protein